MTSVDEYSYRVYYLSEQVFAVVSELLVNVLSPGYYAGLILDLICTW